jgi:hypothetical protein
MASDAYVSVNRAVDIGGHIGIRTLLIFTITHQTLLSLLSHQKVPVRPHKTR